ncbi:hypothetical protein COL00_22170 [Bacillus cereus]|nr:hypothetical protein COL00_22170 [Bacillus cereus]
MFMQRLVKASGEPSVLTTNTPPSLLYAFKSYKNIPSIHTHYTIKHCNNRMDMSNGVFTNVKDFKIFVILHVQSKASKLFMLYINKTKVHNQTVIFDVPQIT